MISIIWSKSVGKSNTKYYDVVIKWVNITTLIISIDKTYTLCRDVVIKWLNVVTLSYYLLLYQTTIISNDKLTCNISSNSNNSIYWYISINHITNKESI